MPRSRTHTDPSGAGSTPRTAGAVFGVPFGSISRNVRPSKRTRPFSAPIQRYPSVVCVTACTGPPGKPRSPVHSSRTYCDIARCACTLTLAAALKHTVTAAAALRDVEESLNDDLDVLLRRRGRVAEVVQIDSNAFATRRRDAGGEFVPGHRRASSGVRATDGFEYDAS